jgi:hypothetical protein
MRQLPFTFLSWKVYLPKFYTGFVNYEMPFMKTVCTG